MDDRQTNIVNKEDIKIIYTVIEASAVFSNLWLILLITFTKHLRRSFLFWKVLSCALGDLFVCTILPFVFIIDSSFWKTNVMCQFVRYNMLTYGVFIQLALVSICFDPVLRYVQRRYNLSRAATRVGHFVSLTLPVVFTLAILLPVIHYLFGMKPMKVVNRDMICRFKENITMDAIKTTHAVIFTLQFTVLLPVLFGFMIFAYWHNKKRLTKPSSEIEESRTFRSNDARRISNHGNVNVVNENLKVTFVVAVFSELCASTMLINVMYYNDVFDNEDLKKWLHMVIQITSIVFYSAAIIRPYLWILNKDLRQRISECFIKLCCPKWYTPVIEITELSPMEPNTNK